MYLNIIKLRNYTCTFTYTDCSFTLTFLFVHLFSYNNFENKRKYDLYEKTKNHLKRR